MCKIPTKLTAVHVNGRVAKKTESSQEKQRLCTITKNILSHRKRIDIFTNPFYNETTVNVHGNITKIFPGKIIRQKYKI